MNDIVRSTAAAGAPATRALQRWTGQALSLRDTRRGASSDREFLAPVLEILETPASPVRVAFLWIICALVVIGLGLAYFGRIDIIASAQGKFQPTGRVKVIEPVETGRVAAVHAANGALVKAGAVLVELDRSAAEADVRAASADLKSAEAESLRRRAALAAARARAFSPPPVIAWPPDMDANLRAREEGVLSADLGELAATIASFDAQKAQKSAERDMLGRTIATQKNLIATLQERVDMRAKLVALQSGAKSSRHRRDRDPAISTDPTRHPRGRARFGDDGARRHRARQREGGSGVPVGSGAETRRRRAAGRGRPAASSQG